MAKEEVEHKDKLGRILKLGDCVAFPQHNSLGIGTIKKLNPKMVKVVKVGKSKFRDNGSNKYPQDCVLLDGPEVTMYLLRLNTSS
jgi:hypothetical protein